MINHINIVELAYFPINLGDLDNSGLRVDYLLGKIDEKKWKSKLKAKMKKQEKDREINQVLSMYTQTLSDIFGNINECKCEDVKNFVDGCDKLRTYTNDALFKIGIRFGNVVPCIDKNWTYRKTRKDRYL